MWIYHFIIALSLGILTISGTILVFNSTALSQDALSENAILSAIRKSKVSDSLADDLAGLIRNSILMKTAVCPEDTIPVGSSKIGGLPDLPSGWDWPAWNGQPLSFICQINFEELAPYDTEKVLPTHGILYFFYDAKQSVWGFDPQDRGGWRVLFTENKTGLERTSLPSTLPEEGQFYPCKVDFSSQLTLPPPESELFSEPLSKRDWEAYYDLLESLGLLSESSGVHRVLGHPDQMQGDMLLECQLAFHGLYVGDSSGYNDPRAQQLRSGAKDWRLLVQIDSDDQSGMMWGDVGRLYFWIREEDLRNRQFDNVWLILQCS
ncbi:MAG: YwqG family protein [Firmicutes bacterium]|nr:YwqG family protein [Bacillota bacterium]